MKIQLKMGLIGVITLVFLGGISCRNSPPEAGVELGGGDQKAATDALAEADRLYSQREELGRVRAGVALLRQARIADYGSYEAAWKLSKFCYYLGAHSDDQREQESAYREGADAGKTAVQLQPDKPEGHFWLGANYGGAAEMSAIAGLANIEDIRREMEAVLRIDEGYQAGSAYLALGRLYLEAPRVLGGDNQKAVSYLEKGLRFGNTNALLRVRLAEAYQKTERDADARKQIDFLMKMTPDRDYLPEYKEAVAEAQKLLEKMK